VVFRLLAFGQAGEAQALHERIESTRIRSQRCLQICAYGANRCRRIHRNKAPRVLRGLSLSAQQAAGRRLEPQHRRIGRLAGERSIRGYCGIFIAPGIEMPERDSRQIVVSPGIDRVQAPRAHVILAPRLLWRQRETCEPFRSRTMRSANWD
jgi:hypothetical protein